MKHYLNVCDVNGAEIEPVDVITFGSPCQDLSVAGKRAGIQDGERSNLFFEAIRIIKEMRKVTNGEYPKYAVWENVPGAFSSNKGHDFHAVLEALCSVCDSTVSIPKPCEAKRPDNLVWNKAGEIVGDSYSIAWRTLDAQYWGVPQRRKRIYLVADFRGRRAGEILFKPDSLRGNMQEGDEAGEGASADAVGGVDGSIRAVGIDGYNFALTGDKAATVGVNCGISTGRNGVIESVDGSAGNGITVFSFDSLSSNSMKSSNPFSGCRAVDVAKCIDTTYPDPSKNQGGVAVVQEVVAFSQNQREEVRDLNGKAGALAAETGVHQQTYVCQTVVDALPFNTTQITSPQNGNNPKWGDPCHCLASTDHPPAAVITLQANGIDRADTAGCNGKGWRENESYTLNTVDRHAVCYSADCRNGALNRELSTTLQAKPNGGFSYNCISPVVYDARGNGDGETACTITGDHQNRITDYTAVAVQEALAISGKQQSLATSENMANTLGANDWKEPQSVCYKDKPPRKYIIRRLLPVECARLQGFPDEWGKIPAITEMSDEDYDFWTECRKVKAMIDGKRFQPKTKEQTIKWYNKLHTDSAEYKAYGNGLALPCAAFVLRGIAKEGAKTLGSLFDGIGGFPLAGLLHGITPLFSSEVEPYPIAVTKARLN